MTASQNGWRVITRAECTDVQLPGGILPVHPEFAWLAWDCAHLWHETVEPLEWPGNWGWAEPRPIRGKTAGPPTNHASGTAWDLGAPKHPRGVPITKTFTPAQLEAIGRLEARYFGVLRWGGRWTGADVDGMHWEGIPGVELQTVRDATDRLRAEDIPTPAPAPAPAPGPAPAGPGWTGPDLTGTGVTIRGDVGNNGPRVQRLQDQLRANYFYARDGLGPSDGYWGPKLSAVLAEFATRSGIRGADGRNIGPQIARKLYLAGIRP